MNRKHALRKAVRLALQSGALASAGIAGSLYGQEAGPVAEEIVVTGTRILRQDYTAASPVVSLNAEQFSITGTINAEELINTLPQVVPSYSAGNNNPGNGQSWINLRGLGSVRNLVLVNGKRMVPSNEDGIVDINTIPTAMIERVEVLSGGASAAYGSEAIAGATNFILKDDFEGVDLNVQTGVSAESDTDITNIELVLGSDLADGRGNVMTWATYNEREGLSKGDRAFSRQAVSQTSFFPSGHVRRAAGNSWTLDSVQDVFVNQYGAAAPSALGTLVGNDDGTLFTQGGEGEGVINFREVIGEGIDGLYVAQNFIDEEYSYNFEPFNNLVIPQDRLNFGAKLNYDVSDNVEVYTQLLFTNYSSDTRLAPSPAPTGRNITNPAAGFEFTVPYDNPFVANNPGLSAILASRTGDNVGLDGSGPTEDFIYRRRFIENGPRIESYERDVYQWIGGVTGELTDNWSYDVYYSQGKYNEQLDQNGNVSVTRVESLLDAPDGGVSICAGGLNPIGANTLSRACADYVGVLAKNTTQIDHRHAEAVLSGNVFAMPGGDASLAVGLFWQEFDYRFLADEILATGDVSGFNAQDNIIGKTDNNDIFAELRLPVLDAVEVTAGFRRSDHSISGANNSYKLEMDWAITDSLRFRASGQRAVRAPNIGELFSPQNEDNPDVNDPCNFDGAFRTGPDAAQVESLCVAQGILPSEIATYSQSTDQISAFRGGNLDLQEETADTFTVGVVLQPTDRLQVSLDYYNIEVVDVIDFVDPSIVTSRCFNAAGANPTYDINNEWCTKFGRSPTSGEIIDLLELYENIGGLKTDGFDLQVDWGLSFGSHDVSFNWISTFVNENSESPQPGDAYIDYVGSIGDDVGEAKPDFKATFNTMWIWNKWSTVLRLRYLPSMIHEEAVLVGSSNPDDCDCTGVSAVTYADLSASYQATDSMQFRLGIRNLTDEAPQLYTPDQDSGTNPTVYDVVGRSYYLMANFSF